MSASDDLLFADELPFSMDDTEVMESSDAPSIAPAPADGQPEADDDVELACWRLLSEARGVQMANHVAGLRLDSNDAQGMADMAAALSLCLPSPVVLREADGSRAAGECLRCLRHSFFILRSLAGDEEFLIMDPRFREQFLLHNPSPRYQRVYALLPEAYVGKPAVLRRLVELLAHEIQLSCAAAGASLPPWRATKSLLSKWFPACFHDATYRWGERQPLPSLAPVMQPAAVRALPAQTITGFDAPCATSAAAAGAAEEDYASGGAPRAGDLRRPRGAAPSLVVRASPLGSVKPSVVKPPAAAAGSAQLWQIRTVKLGSDKPAARRLPSYVLA